MSIKLADNPLLKAVLGKFRRHFCPRGQVLWANKTQTKPAHLSGRNIPSLCLSEIPTTDLPDVLILDEPHARLFLVDVAHTRVRINLERRKGLCRVIRRSKLNTVFVTVLQSRRALQQIMDELPWGTSAWLADDPEHMIHFDTEPIPPHKRSPRR